jgi:hypothetical protein
MNIDIDGLEGTAGNAAQTVTTATGTSSPAAPTSTPTYSWSPSTGSLTTIPTASVVMTYTVCPSCAPGAGIPPPTYSTLTAEQANVGYEEPCYEPGTSVQETQMPQQNNGRYVRFYTEGQNNPEVSWFAKYSDVEGLTPEQIAELYSLPSGTPNRMVDVNPSGQTVRIGTAAANKWGTGGGTQYQFTEQVPPENFSNPQTLQSGQSVGLSTGTIEATPVETGAPELGGIPEGGTLFEEPFFEEPFPL